MFSDRLCLLLCLLALLCSCSVKEDRNRCPCTVSLNIDRLPAVATVRDGGGNVLSRTLVETSPAVIEVPHGLLSFSFGAMDSSAEPPADEIFAEDGAVQIEPGEECPKVWLEYCGAMDTSGELVELSPVLHRSFALLTLNIVHPEGETVPYDVSIDGEVDGYGPDCAPSEGAFGVRLAVDERFSCSLSLPRQRDNSLMLHIVSGERILRSFALGETLSANGYDWSAPDLSDIEVTIDYRFSMITLGTDLWSISVPLEIVV
ncbi:MAG: hypothetical protein IKR69_03185 [Bacteroidales bacterium]|nr:hypothetical protein [Bacteroidales bacterium]